MAFLRGMGVPSLESALSVTLLCHDFGSRKLIGKGARKVALLRRIDDPPLGSNRALAFLRQILGSHKLIEEGELFLAFLRSQYGPPLTGGSDPAGAFLRFW